MTMPPPSICGPMVSSRRALLALTWSIINILTIFAFCTAVTWAVKIESHYNYMASLQDDDFYNNNNNNNNDCNEGGEGEGEGEGGEDCHHSGDEEENRGDYYYYPMLASVKSNSMTFVVLYTTGLALALSFYGTTAIVGFTSARGVYIAPCFSQESMWVGMFGGALVIFANLLLLCAVIFGEFRVEDYLDQKEKEEMEPYAVERIAGVLAVTCMFLSILYVLFSLLLFIFHPALTNSSSTGVDDRDETDPNKQWTAPSVISSHHSHHHVPSTNFLSQRLA